MSPSPRRKSKTKRHRSQVERQKRSKRLEWPPAFGGLETFNNPNPLGQEDGQERNKLIMIFLEESNKSEHWKQKYIHSSMFLLGYGAYGSVFQVTTRLYQSKNKINRERYVHHPDFLALYASQRRLRMEEFDKLRDKGRHERLFDTVAIKFEILEQSQLEDGVTRFFLFLRREFLVLDALWRRCPRQLIGFPAVFDFGYIGDRLQYSVNPKYKNTFTYLNIQGEEVKFFGDTSNRNLENVTKLSYMTMEMLGPSIEDYRSYFEPWFARSHIRPFFQAPTAFMIADQLLCRLYTLHRAGFVHHDLKPENMSIGIGHAMNIIYLLDFGFAKQISDCPVCEWMGSRKYIAIDVYNTEKPNYAQDIESWFYLVVALLFDSLPWSDDVILPLLDPGAEEGAKWMLVMAIKKTWWGEYSMAHTLHSTLEGMAALHLTDLPDIQQIMQQLHKKVRDLRGHLRQIQDSKSLNSELSNSNSEASKGYMSIRKVLLQIFHLPNIDTNPALGDNEFRNYQDTRKAQGLEPYKWDPNNFDWEWDKNHDRMTSERTGSIGTDDGIHAMSRTLGSSESKRSSSFFADVEKLTETHNTERVRNQLSSLASFLDYGARAMRTRLAEAPAPPRPEQPPLAADGRRQRPDEVSYVYDVTTNTLVPKLYDHRRRFLRQQQLQQQQQQFQQLQQQQQQQQQRRPKSADYRARVQARVGDDEETSDEELWQLAHPSCLM